MSLKSWLHRNFYFKAERDEAGLTIHLILGRLDIETTLWAPVGEPRPLNEIRDSPWLRP